MYPYWIAFVWVYPCFLAYALGKQNGWQEGFDDGWRFNKMLNEKHKHDYEDYEP